MSSGRLSGWRRAGACAAGAGAVALGVLALPACNLVGPVAYLAMGPEKVKKAHALDAARPTVVFIDDRASRLPQRSIRRMIGQVAEQRLLSEKVLTNVISSQGAMDVTTREAFSRPIGIAEIGQMVDAEVVIYATVDEFTLSQDGQSFSPRCVMRVKVVDAVSRERSWPQEGSGWHTVVVDSPFRQGYRPTNSGERIAAERQLAERAGRALAALFFDHVPEPKGGE